MKVEMYKNKNTLQKNNVIQKI